MLPFTYLFFNFFCYLVNCSLQVGVLLPAESLTAPELTPCVDLFLKKHVLVNGLHSYSQIGSCGDVCSPACFNKLCPCVEAVGIQFISINVKTFFKFFRSGFPSTIHQPSFTLAASPTVWASRSPFQWKSSKLKQHTSQRTALESYPTLSLQRGHILNPCHTKACFSF